MLTMNRLIRSAMLRSGKRGAATADTLKTMRSASAARILDTPRISPPFRRRESRRRGGRPRQSGVTRDGKVLVLRRDKKKGGLAFEASNEPPNVVDPRRGDVFRVPQISEGRESTVEHSSCREGVHDLRRQRPNFSRAFERIK